MQMLPVPPTASDNKMNPPPTHTHPRRAQYPALFPGSLVLQVAGASGTGPKRGGKAD